MPLSEQEQRLLDEMERGLYQSSQDRLRVDPSSFKLNVRALVIGIAILIAGLVVLLVGVSTHLMIVGILGFVVMFGGVLFALASPRRPRDAAPSAKSTTKDSSSS
jgi:predicted phage tail protein